MFEVAVAWEDVKLWVAWSCFETSPALRVVGLAALWVHIRIRFSDWKTRPSCRWTRSDWWTGPKRFPGYRKWGGGDVLLMPGDGFFSKNYFPWISFLIDEEISVNVLIFFSAWCHLSTRIRSIQPSSLKPRVDLKTPGPREQQFTAFVCVFHLCTSVSATLTSWNIWSIWL